MVDLNPSQIPGIRSRGLAQPGLSTSPSMAEPPPGPGSGGLLGRMIGLGGGEGRQALHALADEARAMLEEPGYASARSAPAGAAETVLQPVTVGSGEQRGEILGWAARAKAAFKAFFAPVANGLAALGRFVVEWPSRLWAGITAPQEKMGGPVLDRHFAAYLHKTPGPRELQDDRLPASTTGDARYICRGMGKDLARMDYFIGGAKMEPHAPPGGTAQEHALQSAATALLNECQGDTALCMTVSHFAFQNVVGFQTHAVKEGWLLPEGASSGAALIEQPKDKSVSIARLPDGRIHLLFELENQALSWLLDGEGAVVQLDSAASAATTRFSFVVHPDLSIEPCPLNPGSKDKSAVAYSFRVKPLLIQG